MGSRGPSPGTRPPPTAEEVIEKLKNEGDFDSLRLGIIRKVKENEELRSIIINEVMQSSVDDIEGLEKKPKQLSDNIYQEVGSKLMGLISDEVWRIIRSADSKSQIKEAVDAVYNRLINSAGKNDDGLSPSKSALPPDCSKANEVNASPHRQLYISSENGNALGGSKADINTSNEQVGPPGSVAYEQHISTSIKEESKEMLVEHSPSSLSTVPNNCQSRKPEHNHGELPQGLPLDVAGHPVDTSDEDPDVPPGFG